LLPACVQTRRCTVWCSLSGSMSASKGSPASVPVQCPWTGSEQAASAARAARQVKVRRRMSRSPRWS
jgi:hypothetical protein